MHFYKAVSLGACASIPQIVAASEEVTSAACGSIRSKVLPVGRQPYRHGQPWRRAAGLAVSDERQAASGEGHAIDQDTMQGVIGQRLALPGPIKPARFTVDDDFAAVQQGLQRHGCGGMSILRRRVAPLGAAVEVDVAGKWQGTNPINPAAATWKPWALKTPDELRPPPPPDHDSAGLLAELAELKSFARTPRTNSIAVYWETFGGVRSFQLWNEHASRKILEYGLSQDPAAATYALAAMNIAMHDACIACWDAKFTYWQIRPSQLDPELKPLFPPPNHPSYPAAHGCISTAAAVVLARLFPGDADTLLAIGKEAADARIYAGIHYRSDIDAGQALGRAVAEKVLARASVR